MITDTRELHQRAIVERACRWLIERHYATGHGETIEEVLKELEWQAKERGHRQARYLDEKPNGRETEKLR